MKQKNMSTGRSNLILNELKGGAQKLTEEDTIGSQERSTISIIKIGSTENQKGTNMKQGILRSMANIGNLKSSNKVKWFIK